MSEKQTIGDIVSRAPKPAPVAKDKIVERQTIRTMQKDIDSLRKPGFVESPQNLPVAEEGVKKTEDKLREQEEGRKEAEEKAEIQKKLAKKLREQEEERKEAEKKLREQEEKRKEAEKKLREQEEERKKVEDKLREQEEGRKIKEDERREKEAEKIRQKEQKRKAKEERLAKKKEIQKQKRQTRAMKIIAFNTWLKVKLPVLLKFSLAGIVAISIMGVIAGFMYWWNYIRVVAPPVAVTHYQCRNFQCVSVEGEGVDQCQTEQDCKPAEPEIPQSLIPVDKTETIEISAGHKELFIQELKLILEKDEEKNILNGVLVKISGQTESKYADLNDFLLLSGINLPERIVQSAAADELGGANYTFFLYNQTEGKRLGFVLKIVEGVDIKEELKEWEPGILENAAVLFTDLKDIILSAAMEEFQDNIYKDIAIRYINFPNPDLSVDYAIIGDKLIITTSKESMYAAIDALLPVKIQ